MTFVGTVSTMRKPKTKREEMTVVGEGEGGGRKGQRKEVRPYVVMGKAVSLVNSSFPVFMCALGKLARSKFLLQVKSLWIANNL